MKLKISPEHAGAVQPDTGTKTNRRLDIQGLRAIAVLMVVAFHSGLPVPGGFIGVDVFFVISGFVITTMLKHEWVTTERIRFGAFYIRRFKRLAPALALMVTVTMLTSALVLSPLGTQQTAAKTAIGATLLVANIVIARTTGGYFDAPATTNPLLNVWSLSVEEQFYLAFPAVLAAGWLIARRARPLWAAPSVFVLSIAVVSFGAASFNAAKFAMPHPRFMFGFYDPVSRAWEFAAGALLALVATRAVIKSRSLALTFGVLGALLLVSSLWLITGAAPFPGPRTLLPVIGALLLLLAGGQNSNPVTRALAAKPMVKIGDWSYSIYLWHWPLIVFATFLWPNSSAAVFAAALLAFAPALASYKWIEQPIRGMSASGLRLACIALITLAPPLVVSGGLEFAAKHGFWSPTVMAYQAAIMTSHAGAAAGCDTSVALGMRPWGECTWNASEFGPPIFLVGDSNADHLSEAVIGAGATLHRPVLIATSRACPFVDGPEMEATVGVWERAAPPGTFQSLQSVCSAYEQGTLNYLKSSVTGLVVISMSDKYWFGPGLQFDIGLNAEPQTADQQERVKALSSDLKSIVKALQQARQKVMFVQSTPKWHDDYPYNPSTCPMLTVLRRQCSQEMPREWAEREQSTLRRALRTVANQTGAVLLDSWTSLCPNATCATQTDGLIRYRDETHISVAQSEALAPVFAKAIASAE